MCFKLVFVNYRYLLTGRHPQPTGPNSNIFTINYFGGDKSYSIIGFRKGQAVIQCSDIQLIN